MSLCVCLLNNFWFLANNILSQLANFSALRCFLRIYKILYDILHKSMWFYLFHKHCQSAINTIDLLDVISYSYSLPFLFVTKLIPITITILITILNKYYHWYLNSSSIIFASQLCSLLIFIIDMRTRYAKRAFPPWLY